MNTSFKPSEFDKQASASLDMMDEEAAAKRVQAILHPQTGPTLTPQPHTQPQAPATRKKRSDAGVPKKAPADPDEITLRISCDRARKIALKLGESADFMDDAALIQDQIIAQLQKRLDALQKGK